MTAGSGASDKTAPPPPIPSDPHEQIALDRLTEEFLPSISAFFQHFDGIQDRERYFQIGKSLAIIIPELVRGDRYDDILRIVDSLDRHAQDKKDAFTFADHMLDDLSKSGGFQELKTKFQQGNKEICEAIAPIFLKMRRRSVVHLLTLVNGSNRHLVRKLALEALLQIDPSAVDLIFHDLPRAGTETTTDIVRIMGELRWGVWNQPVAHALKRYLTHENPRVREEALTAYCKTRGIEAEKLCLTLLHDPDAGVQKRAIQCLATMRSRQALDIFVAMLKKIEEAPDERNDQMDVPLFGALGFYENVERSVVISLEEMLLRRLDQHLRPTSPNLLERKKEGLSPDAITAICDTLGRIGTTKSCPILQELGDQDGSGKEHARSALARIAERGLQASRASAPPPH